MRVISKPKLYLHIGCGKTGTSALQRFFWENSSALYNEFKIWYPKRIYREKDHIVGRYSNAPFLLPSREVALQRIARHAARSACSILISSEVFSQYPPTFLSKAQQLFDIIPICYVREPVEWLYSAWKQSFETEMQTATFEEYINSNPKQFLFIKEYISIFPSIKLLSFTENKKSLLKSFFSSINITIPDKYKLANTNTSISEEERKILEICNKHKLFELSNNLSATFLEQEHREKQEIKITRHQHKTIMDNNREFLSILHDHFKRNDIFYPAAFLIQEHNDVDPYPFYFSEKKLDQVFRTISYMAPRQRVRIKIKTSATSVYINDVPDDFDPYTYLELNPEVLESDLDVYAHFITIGKDNDLEYKKKIITLDDVVDRFQSSVYRQLCPLDFDCKEYLRMNIDVLQWVSSEHPFADPYRHYVEEGTTQGRSYIQRSNVELLKFYANSPFQQHVPEDFNAETYLELHPDVLIMGLDPYRHYQENGRAEGRRYIRMPIDELLLLYIDSPFQQCVPKDFDPSIYLELNPDVYAAQVDPYRHYHEYGLLEDRAYKRIE